MRRPLLAAAWVLSFALSTASDVTPRKLLCESTTNPLGVDAPRPRLSWQLQSNEHDQVQTAYQILAATDPKLLNPDAADLWNSGKVESRESLQIEYAGPPLTSGQHVYWTVRAWDRNSTASAWGEPAQWEMSLLSQADWKAQWICRDKQLPDRDEDFFKEDPAPLLRKEFTLDKPVRRARAYVSGLGYYELRINGRRVGDHVLDPGWTDYSKRVLYSTYDVTGLLTQGPNAVGVMLGNGWYNPLPIWGWGSPDRNLRKHLTIGRPRAILQLNVEYDDGAGASIVTDQSWKAAPGPIIRNSSFLGEEYDARAERPGWDRPNYDDSAWEPVAVATQPVGPLQAQTAPPIRVIERIRPVAITEPKPGTFIVDMGRNFAGVVALRVRGARGTRVTMRSGEILFPGGTLNGRTSAAMQIKTGGASGGPGCPVEGWQTDVYTLRGGSEGTQDGAEETSTPRFTFHGFRYVELTGFPGTPTLDSLEGLALSSDVRRVGEFTCSDDLFNRIHQMVLHTFRSNLFSVQSDCPHREKFGYGGDLAATSEAFMLNFDMSMFYRKSVHDLADAARPNAGFTETAPYVGIADESLGDGAGPIGWGTSHPLLCAQLLQYYADKRLAQEQYPAVQKWMSLLEAKASNGVLDNGIGDHESLVPKSRAVTGSAFYYLNANLAAQLAESIGAPREESSRYRNLAQTIRAGILTRFFDPATGRVESGTQCNQAALTQLGVLKGAGHAAAVRALAADIESRDFHLTTGIFGTRWMLMTLSDSGRADLAYRIVQQESFPGWGHMLKNGATTLWETWAFSDNVYSHNHPMFGSVDEWFYRVVAGIGPAPDAAGFDKIVIRPRPGGGLTWAKASYDSPRGPISSEWRLDEGKLHLSVTIPANASALVYMPAGGPVENAQLLQFEPAPDGSRFCRIGSGSYEFRTTLAK